VGVMECLDGKPVPLMMWQGDGLVYTVGDRGERQC